MSGLPHGSMKTFQSSGPRAHGPPTRPSVAISRLITKRPTANAGMASVTHRPAASSTMNIAQRPASESPACAGTNAARPATTVHATRSPSGSHVRTSRWPSKRRTSRREAMSMLGRSWSWGGGASLMARTG